jgi:hypothetical protein
MLNKKENEQYERLETKSMNATVHKKRILFVACNLNASLQKCKPIKMMAVKEATGRIAGPSYVGA